MRRNVKEASWDFVCGCIGRTLGEFSTCAVEGPTIVDELFRKCSGRVGGEAKGLLNKRWTVQRRLGIFGFDGPNRRVPSIKILI